MAALGVVEGLDVVKTASRASALVGHELRSISSVSREAKKLSAMALSYASPTEPIDRLIPASRQRRPKARLV